MKTHVAMFDMINFMLYAPNES